MPPLPKRHALVIWGGVHGFPGVLGIVLADFLEAEAVKEFWRGVKGRIHGYGLCGDANGGIGWDGEAIRECVRLGDDAFEGYYYAVFYLERWAQSKRNKGHGILLTQKNGVGSVGSPSWCCRDWPIWRSLVCRSSRLASLPSPFPAEEARYTPA